MAKETSGNIEQGQNGGNSEVDNRIDVNTVVGAPDAPVAPAPADAHVVVDGEVINLAELSADEILDLLDREEGEESEAREDGLDLAGEEGAIRVADSGEIISDFSFDDPGNIHLAQAGDGGTGAGGGEGGVPTGAWWALGGLGAIGIAAAAGGGGGGGGSAPPPNTAPEANPDSADATEGGNIVTGSLRANDTDAETAPENLTYAAATGQGSVPGLTVNADGSFSFNPNNAAYQNLADGESQTITFDYTVTDDGANDGNPLSDSSTLTITITGTNDAPVATADSDAATEDGPIVTGSVAGNDNDVDDGATLTFAAAAGQGAVPGLTFNGDGSYSFDPSVSAYQGLSDGETQQVTFNYTVTDEFGASSDSTLTITVTGANDAPTAVNDVATATEDDPTISGNLVANDTDVDGDTLTVAPASGQGPVAGLTVNTDGSYTFNPSNAAYQSLAQGEEQVVTYDYVASDGNGGSDTGTLTITLTGANDAPNAVADVDTATEDGAIVTGSVAGNDTDVDNGAMLSYAAATGQGPVAGLTFNADGTYSFDPSNAAYQGLAVGETQDVTFDYAVTDENGASDTATLTITVTGANDAPTAVDDAATATEGGGTISGNVLANDSDPDGDAPLSVSPTGNVAPGLDVNADGSYTFDPTVAAYNSLNVGQSQVVSYTYTVSDGNGGTDTGVLSITVQGTNDAPVAVADTDTATEDGPIVTGSLAGNDSDPDNGADLTYSADGPVPAGLTLMADGSYSFDPTVAAYDDIAQGDTRDVTLGYTVTDENGATASSTLTITVTGANDAPVANDDSNAATEGGATVSGNVITDMSTGDTDVDGDMLSVINIMGLPAGLTLNANGNYSFDPTVAAYDSLSAGEQQDVSYTYTVSDGNGGTAQAVLTITVTGTNDAPVAGPAFAGEVLETEVLTVAAAQGLLSGATDVDNDFADLTVNLVGPQPDGLMVNTADGSFTYDPPANFDPSTDSPVTFQYQVVDPDGGLSAVQTATIDVTPVQFTFTPMQDNFEGDVNGTPTDDTFLASNNNLQAGDTADGLDDVNGDTVVHRVDGNVAGRNFAGFEFDNIETFEVTSDSGNAEGPVVDPAGGLTGGPGGPAVFPGGTAVATTWDLSQSGPIDLLRNANSTDDVEFNNAALNNGVVGLDIDTITNPNADTTLDVRDQGVGIGTAGNDDTVNVTINSASNTLDSIDDLTIDGGIENVSISTRGGLPVIIDTLLSGPGGMGSVADTTNLTLDAQSAPLTIRDFLPQSVTTVDGSSSTQNLDFDANDAAVNQAGNPSGTTLTGGSGNDTIGGSDQADQIVSGAGNDTINNENGDDSVTTGEGNDVVNDGAGDSDINTGAGDDTVNDGAGNDSIVTEMGDDVVNMGPGNDKIDTGAGNDVVNTGDNANANLTNLDTVTGGADDDTLNVFGNNAASDLNNVQQFELVDLQDLGANSYNFFISNNVNNNLFWNDGTRVTVDGTDLDSNQTLTFDANDRPAALDLIGGDGGDFLIGGQGDDTIIGDGDSGPDTGGNDTLVGDAGDDTFVFDGGELTAADTVDGGTGNDTAILVSNTNDTTGADAGTATQDDDIDEAFTIGANFGADTDLDQIDNTESNVENVIVTDVNPALGNFTSPGFEANGGDVSLLIQAGFAQGTLDIDATDLDANEAFRLDASAQVAGENLTVRSGAGDDSLAFGDGNDSVDAGDGDDIVDFTGGSLNLNDIVDGGNADTMLPGTNNGNPTNMAQSFGNELQVNAGTSNANHSGVDNFTTLSIQNAGTTSIGSNLEDAGVDLVNLNAPGMGGTADTLDASGYSTDLTVNDFAGDDSITTGGGNDDINFGSGNDSVASGAGDDEFFVQGMELGLGDGILGGADTDTVQLVNNTPTLAPLDVGAVNANVNLDNVASVENYSILNSGDDGQNEVNEDFDDNTLTFSNGAGMGAPGNVGTTTIINVDASNLTDMKDSFEVILDGPGGAELLNGNYVFNVTGSATNDAFTKNNVNTQNDLLFFGGGDGDRLTIDTRDLNNDVTFDGDALNASTMGTSNSVAVPGDIRTTGGLIGPDGTLDQLVISGGPTLIDGNFSNDGMTTGLTNIEVLTSTAGTALNAELGQFAGDSGINIIVGSSVGDTVTFNAAFTPGNDPAMDTGLLVDLSNGGADSINAGAIDSVVTFLADADDFGAGDALTGGSTSDDLARVRNNGSADFTDASGAVDRGIENIEVIDVDPNGGGDDVTVAVDTTAADLDGTNVQTIDASELSAGDSFTLQGGTATANLDVTGGNGDDNIVTGSGADQIDAGTGDDLVSSGAGIDSIDGGTGNDAIQTGGRDGLSDQVQAGDGADFVVAGTGGDEISLGASDNDTDTVQINPASFMGPGIDVSDDYDPAQVNDNQGANVLEIFEFEGGAGGDVLQLSPVLFADANPPAQGDTGMALQAGQSWPDAGFPELVVVTTTANATQAGTAEGVRQFLAGSELAEAPNGAPPGTVGNNENGLFAVTDGTDTYLWLYQDDGNSSVSGSDFTLLGVVRGVNNLDPSQLTTDYGFTPLDDTMQVLSGSSIDGLGGNDTAYIVPDDGNPTSLTTNSIETIHGTSGDDTVTTTDINGNAEDADTVDFFSNGGNDTFNMSNGQTVVTHSNVTFNVGGGMAIDDDANSLLMDSTPETVILADDDTNPPHDITLTGDTMGNPNAGVDSVQGSSGDDTLTWQTRNSISVDGGENNGSIDTDVVNGANGGQVMDLDNVESLQAGDGDDMITADAELVAANLGEGDDDLLMDEGASGAVINGNLGDDDFTATGDVVDSTLNGNDGDDTFAINEENVGLGGNVINSDINGGENADTVSVEGNISGAASDISGGNGADTIEAANVESGAEVNGDAGMDDIDITGEVRGSGTAVRGGIEDDDIFVGANVTTGALVDGQDGDDSIFVDDGVESNGTVNGGANDDMVEVGFVDGGNVLGGAGVDSIDSGNVFNGGLVDGQGGDDSIDTGAVSNGSTVTGGDNDDIVATESVDNAEVLGDQGIDSIDTETVSNGGLVDGGTEGDFITVTGNVESGSTATGGAGNDDVSITGNLDSATLLGEGGNDDLTVGGNVDNGVINGGAGDDTISVIGTTTDSQLDGGGENDVFTFGGAVTNTDITGGLGNNDVVNGSDMDDEFNLTEVESLAAMDGNDTVTADGALVRVDLGNDNDYITYEADLADAMVAGGAGNDTVFTQDVTDSTILGQGDEDQVSVNGDVDGSEINGGTGNDMLTVNGDVEGASTVLGGGLNDVISVTGDVDASTVTGDDGAGGIIPGADSISVGGNLVNGALVDGEADDDIIDVGEVQTGSQVLGGSNDDTIGSQDVTGGSTVDGGTGMDGITVAGDVTGGSTVSGGTNDDIISITGEVTGSSVFGGNQNPLATDGADFINIGSNVNGMSTVTGGTQDDTIAVDGDVDGMSTVDGGLQADTISVSGDVAGAATVAGGMGADTIDVGMDVTGAGTSVQGNAGEDDISVVGIVNAGAVVDGGTEADIISVNAVDGGGTQILGGDGADDIDTDAVSGGALVDGEEATDDIDVAGSVTTGSTVLGGDAMDNISITGSVNASLVRGDGGTPANDGNDTVTINGGVESGATVMGDGGGDDIDVGMNVTGGGTSVQGNAGTDNISVGGIVNGGAVVDGGTEADIISVNAVDGGGTQILGGAGADNIDTDAVSNGALVDGGDDGTDDIDVNGDVTGGATVQGGEGADEVSITGNVDDSSVRGDEGMAAGGADTVNIGGNVQNGATVDGDGGADSIDVGGSLNDGSTLIGGDGDDDITVDAGVLGGAQLVGGEGADEISITGGVDGTGTVIRGDADGSGGPGAGDGADTINIDGNVSDMAVVNADGLDDTIDVNGDVTGGAQVAGGDNDDMVTIDGNVDGGLLAGDDAQFNFVGDDSLSVTGDVVNGGTVLGEAGDDDVSIAGAVTDSTVNAGTMTADDDQDDVTIGGAVTNSTLSGGSDDDNFILQDAVTDSTINGGDDNDVVSITGAASNVSIDGGEGGTDVDSVTTGDTADSLNLAGVETLTTAGGADSVNSDGALLNAQLGADDDTLAATGTIMGGLINGGMGADDISVENLDMMSTVLGGTGTDEITASGNVTGGSTIDGGGDIDMISVNGTVTGSNILGGAQGDSIALDVVDVGSTVDGGDDVDEIATGNVLGGSTVTGGNEDDDISVGGEVNDSLIQGGNDNGADNITVVGNVLADSTVDGGDGDDDISIDGMVAGGSTILGGNALDDIFIDAGVGNTAVDGSTVDGGGQDDTISITGDVNGATITGGAGADLVTVDGKATGSMIDMGMGADTVTFSGGIDPTTVLGGAGDDMISVGGDVFDGSTVDGGADADTILISGDVSDVGANGGSTVLGGMGDDSISVGGDVINSTINGGDGDDTLDVDGAYVNATILGIENATFTENADTVTADSNLQNADMLAGDDQLTYSEAVDATVDGGDDTDTVIGSGMGDTLTLTNVESIVGGGGDDDITADGTALNADLGMNDDILSFTAGANATIDGGAGDDTVNGSSDGDVLQVTTVQSVSAMGGADQINLSGNSNMIIDGGADTDTVTGIDDGIDTLTLTQVESIIAAGGADDITADGTALNADLGTGADSIRFSEGATAVVDGGDDTDTVFGSGDADMLTLTNVESIEGAGGADDITADGTALNADLGNGSDVITFSEGANATIDGGADGGQDTINGSSMDDDLTFDALIEVVNIGSGGSDDLTINASGGIPPVTINGFDPANDSVTNNTGGGGMVGDDFLAIDGNTSDVAVAAGTDVIEIQGVDTADLANEGDVQTLIENAIGMIEVDDTFSVVVYSDGGDAGVYELTIADANTNDMLDAGEASVTYVAALTGVAADALDTGDVIHGVDNMA